GMRWIIHAEGRKNFIAGRSFEPTCDNRIRHGHRMLRSMFCLQCAYPCARALEEFVADIFKLGAQRKVRKVVVMTKHWDARQQPRMLSIPDVTVSRNYDSVLIPRVTLVVQPLDDVALPHRDARIERVVTLVQWSVTRIT